MSAGGDLGEVRLQAVPGPTVYFAQEQHDALLRELELVILGASLDQDDATLAALRLDLLVLRQVFDTFRPMVVEQVPLDGTATATYDFALVVPVELAELADRGNELFDRLESYCGGLLLLAPPPVLASGFRRWFLGQIADQLRGGAPEPWPAWWAVHGDGSPPEPAVRGLR